MEVAAGNASSIQFFIHVAPSDIKTKRVPNLPNDSIKSSIVLVKSLLLLNWATYCELLIQPCFESACMQSLLLKKTSYFHFLPALFPCKNHRSIYLRIQHFVLL